MNPPAAFGISLRLSDRDALDLFQKMVKGRVAEFAVGDDGKPDVFLKLHDIADVLVFERLVLRRFFRPAFSPSSPVREASMAARNSGGRRKEPT